VEAAFFTKSLRRAGPYLLVELLLPGGTLVALVLWLSSALGRGQFADVQSLSSAPVCIERIVRLGGVP
jgi:hypothetical protein